MTLQTSPSLASGSWSNNFDSVTDWNIVTEPMPGLGDRRVKCSRGRFLGGCSGVNGTLCIRGIKQDYDDWEMQGWSGDEMFKYMAKVRKPSLTASQCSSISFRPKHFTAKTGFTPAIRAMDTAALYTLSLTI